MGKAKRIGRSNVIWWPSVRAFLQKHPEEYYTAEQILDGAILLGRNSRAKPLYRSPVAPSRSTIGKFLKLRSQVERKRVTRVSFMGTRTKPYAYRWVGNDCE